MSPRRKHDDEDEFQGGDDAFHRDRDEPEQWNPALVGKALVWALKIARATAGATHPRSYGNGMPSVVYTREEIFEMGIEEDRPRRLPPSSIEITRADAVLFWQSRFLVTDPDLIESSAMLKAWLRCRTHRRSFGKECDDRGWARATAYRRRDRALSVISQGLDRDRVPVFRV
jgi:hypothetical protein